MSRIKKSSVLLLVIALLFGLFAGCSRDTTESALESELDESWVDNEQTGSEQDPTEPSGDSTGKSQPATTEALVGTTTSRRGSGKQGTNAPSGPAVDWLKGKTIQIHYNVYDPGKEANTAEGKYAIQQRKAIEEKYGCNLAVSALNLETFIPRLMVGDSQGIDIVDSCGPDMLRIAIENDFFTQLDGLIDFNKSYINKTHSENLVYNKKHYVAVPKKYGLLNIDENLVMFFNKRLVKNAGYNPDDLYKWWKGGTWTWDKLYEVAVKIHALDANTYGVDNGVLDNYLWMALILSNGTELITTENGKPIFNIGSPKSLEALNFWYNLSKYTSMHVAAMDVLFIQGRAGFIPQYVNRLRFNSFSKMKDDFGVIPLPKGPSASKYNSPVSYLWGYAILNASLKGDDKDIKAKALSIIIDELSKPSIPENALERTVNAMFESVVRDKGSYDVLRAINNNSGGINNFSNYYFAMRQVVAFDWNMCQDVAPGKLDVNTAVQQNQDRLSQEYRDSIHIGK